MDLVSGSSPGHGPIQFLLASASEIGFRWDPLALALARPGLLLLMFGVIRFLLIFAVGRVFGWAFAGCPWFLAAS